MPNARLLALAVGASLVVLAQAVAPTADAEVRRQTAPQAFSSGAMRSEQVLRDIKDVLVRIDTRLARIEKDIATLKQKAGTGWGGAGAQ